MEGEAWDLLKDAMLPLFPGPMLNSLYRIHQLGQPHLAGPQLESRGISWGTIIIWQIHKTNAFDLTLIKK